jgi:hypothetical protein
VPTVPPAPGRFSISRSRWPDRPARCDGEDRHRQGLDANGNGAVGALFRFAGTGAPPDFELVVLRDEPRQWINSANLTLLAELRRRAPQAIDWAAMGDVVLVLDAFDKLRN